MKSPRLPRLLLPLALPLFALLLCALPALAKPPAPTDRPELRAFWVDGFNDGFKTPAQCDLLLHRLRAMHCNAVFVQMRKRADAYYATHYEQWAQDDPQHFDSLQYLCDHAHAPGKPRIQIHAWINACAVGGNASAGALTKLHPEWLSLSDTGADYDGEATKIDPGNPDAAEWTYRVYMDVVRHYDVDGIHLDFIRYGGDGKTVGHWGYNVVSVARFNARYHATGRPAWDDPRWQAWRRAQVTSLVRRVYVGATALKPHLVVSAATICWGDPPASDAAYEAHSTSYTEVFAPWRDWMREGILDMNCPMAYFPNARMGQRWRGWNTYAKDRAYGRQVALGVGLYLNSVTSSLAQIDDTRQASASGHHAAGAVLYCYDTPRGANGHEVEGDTSLFAALPTVFRHDAPPPAMPWKDAPTRGAVSGALLAGDALAPVDGATVTARSVETGETRTGESDGNGRFAFVSLPPGAYKVTASWPGGGQNWDVSVLAGKTSQILAAQPGTAAPQAQVAGLGEAADGAHVLLGPALVTSGSDRLGDHFFVADAIGQTPVRVDSGRLALPAITGDRVLVSGTLHHTAAGVVMQADAVRVVGMEIVGAG
jgi:uncharacterized lipoprotein YddW (UPF0748 family)